MKNIVVTLLLALLFHNTFATKQKATIIFAGEHTKTSKTYLGKLKRGDAYRLNDYLQSGTSDQTKGKNDERFAPKELTPQKDRNEPHYLSDTYDINERRLKRRNDNYFKKYLDEKEKALSVKKKNKASKRQKVKTEKASKLPRKTKTRLAKSFRIKGRRLHKGQRIKYRAGNVSLLLKYDIRANGSVKTYVTNLNTRVEGGKKYYLKYYGNDAKRKYYLEPVAEKNRKHK